MIAIKNRDQYSPRKSDSFLEGEVAYYHETGAIFKVKILENMSDRETVGYRFEVVHIVKRHPVHPNRYEIGSVLDCKFDRAYKNTLWEMSERQKS
jgi:hypothetical protein